jgi:hypothetical protein
MDVTKLQRKLAAEQQETLSVVQRAKREKDLLLAEIDALQDRLKATTTTTTKKSDKKTFSSTSVCLLTKSAFFFFSLSLSPFTTSEY